MSLSEYELRVLQDLEASLEDCEPRYAAIERSVRKRRSGFWLIMACVSAPLAGAGLIILGARLGAGGIAVALLGSLLLATPCCCIGPLWRVRAHSRRGPSVQKSGADLS